MYNRKKKICCNETKSDSALFFVERFIVDFIKQQNEHVAQ